jgi:hypothetical protein
MPMLGKSVLKKGEGASRIGNIACFGLLLIYDWILDEALQTTTLVILFQP